MKYKKTITVLSICIVILSILATLTGLLSKQVHSYPTVTTAFGEQVELYQVGLYARNSMSMGIQAIAQDIVTLILGIPLLIISMILIYRNNLKGEFLLTGTIGYFLYTYTSYAFLIMYNPFYLIYVALMTLSFYAFVLCILNMNHYDIQEQFTSKFPVKSLSIVLVITGVMLGGMWLGRIVPSLLSDQAPYGLEHYSTLGIQTLDLGVIVPASFVTAYLLMKKKQLGYLLGVVLVAKMITMTTAVSTMAILMQLNGIQLSIVELIVSPFLSLISIIFIIKVFKTIKA